MKGESGRNSNIRVFWYPWRIYVFRGLM